MGGVAAALAAGVLVGVLARPHAPAPRPQLDEAASSRRAVPVEVAAVQPAPLPAASTPLEVLSPDVARSAARARALPPPPPALPEPRAGQAVEAASAFAPAPRAAAQPPPVVVPQPAPMTQGQAPDRACDGARPGAELMVCEYPRLGRLDQRMSAAYARAVQSGAPYRQLRAEQDDWLAIREDAARHSPEAVASVYRQRIRELEDIADGPAD